MVIERAVGTADAKSLLRAEARERRRGLPEAEREAMSLAVAEGVAGLPEMANACNVHLYLPIPGMDEVSTLPVIERLSEMGKKLSVPVIRQGEIYSAAYAKGAPLLIGQFGVPEPEWSSPAEEMMPDIVVMPLLAFDCRGMRLGSGQGFYDRYLLRLLKSGVRPLRLGVAFSVQMQAELPVDSWDQPLDAVVHEHGIMRFN
ncbi:MAG: 5-formyltetrahydrofolate cyclo-ligase [Chlorobiaceae bacterium]